MKKFMPMSIALFILTVFTFPAFANPMTGITYCTIGTTCAYDFGPLSARLFHISGVQAGHKYQCGFQANNVGKFAISNVTDSPNSIKSTIVPPLFDIDATQLAHGQVGNVQMKITSNYFFSKEGLAMTCRQVS